MGGTAQLSASELRVVDTRERIEENEPVLHSVCDYEYGWGVSRDGFEIYGAKLFHRRRVRDGEFCMMNAVDHIRNGECDLCLAGASDAAVLSSGIAGFAASKALSTKTTIQKARVDLGIRIETDLSWGKGVEFCVWNR